MPSRNNKSEIVQAKLDKKLKYLATIAARQQRRSLSEFIRWAIDQQIKKQENSNGITQ